MENFEERIAAIEQQLEEIKKLKSTPGPRGPAGDISAATNAAEKTVVVRMGDVVTGMHDRLHQSEVSIQERMDGWLANIRAEIGVLKQIIADLREEFKADIAAEMDGQILKTLHDYHLLKDGRPSAEHFMHVFEAKKH